MALLCQNAGDLVGQDAVLDLLVVEELAALGGVVYDLRHLLLVYAVLAGLCERGAKQVVLQGVVLLLLLLVRGIAGRLRPRRGRHAGGMIQG